MRIYVISASSKRFHSASSSESWSGSFCCSFLRCFFIFAVAADLDDVFEVYFLAFLTSAFVALTFSFGMDCAELSGPGLVGKHEMKAVVSKAKAGLELETDKAQMSSFAGSVVVTFTSLPRVGGPVDSFSREKNINPEFAGIASIIVEGLFWGETFGETVQKDLFGGVLGASRLSFGGKTKASGCEGAVVLVSFLTHWQLVLFVEPPLCLKCLIQKCLREEATL